MKNSTHAVKFSLKLSLVALLGSTALSHAQLSTWSGLGSDANWSTAANWLANGAPTNGDQIIFTGSTQTSPNNDLLPANFTFNGITFDANAGAFTLGGNDISVSNQVENASASGNVQTFSANVLLAAPTVFNTVSNDNSGVSGDITAAGTISGTGPLTKIGNGVLVLSNSTFANGTVISNGAVIVGNNNGPYTLAGGALLLDFRSYYTTPAISFTADSAVGIDLPDNTEPRGVDVYSTIGTAGYKFTKIGLGILRMVGGINASSIDVAEGTLASLGGSGMGLTHWGTNLITVENGAMLRADDGGICPNPIVLNGGDGTSDGSYTHLGVLISSSRNNAANPTNNIFTNTITLASDSTIGSYYGNLIISGNVTGPAGLTLIGAAPLVLSGTNDYANGTQIGDGSLLRLGSPTALPSVGNVYLSGKGTIDLNGNNATVGNFSNDGTVTAALDNSSANPASFTVNGSANYYGQVKNTGGGPLSIVCNGGIQLLGVNSYTGSNVVHAQTLEINIPVGTTTGGPLEVDDAAALTLHFGAPGSSLKTSGATFGASGATTLTIDLGNYGNTTKPVINATNGAGVLSANGTITVTFQNTANVSVGQFPIIKYKTRTGNGNFVLTDLGGGIVSKIVTNAANSSIDLAITSAPITTWKGNVNNLWDFATKNWTYSGAATLYTDGGSVYFDDTGLTNSINIPETVSPGSVLLNATKDYVFGGNGPLSGGNLTKNGTGTLTLITTNANSYGNTTIGAGTLQIGNGGTNGLLSSGTVDDEGVLAFNHSDNLTMANTISGLGSVANNNTNILTINNAANTYAGGTVVNQGVLKLGVANTLGAPGAGVATVTVNSGATLDLNGQYLGATNPVIISGAGAPGTMAALTSVSGGGGMNLGYGNIGVNNLVLAGDATIGTSSCNSQIGNSGLGISGNNHVLAKVGNSSIYLRQVAVNSPSQVIIGGGLFFFCENTNALGSAPITLTNNGGLDTWNSSTGSSYSTGSPGLTLYHNITVDVSGGRLVNDSPAYNGSHANYDTYPGMFTLNGTLTLANTAQRGGGVGKITISGPVSGPGGITCNQATTLGGNISVLSGLCTYAGPTVVNSGTLQLSSRQQGGGLFTNSDPAVLDVPAQTGYSTVPMSTLTLGTTNGSTLSFARLLTLTTNAPITATNLNLVGTNSVIVAATVLTAPGHYPLIKYTTLSGGGAILANRGAPATIVTNVLNSTIDLVVPGGSAVTWVGNQNNTWDINSTPNWLYQSAGTTYQEVSATGDAVTFDDTSSVTNVNLAATVSPYLIVVSNNTKAYTLTGSAISGPGGLLKEGTGTLVLSNGANTFSGGAVIVGGTVKLGNAGSLNNSSGTATVSGNGALDFNYQQPTVLACTISGTGFNGLGTLVANYTNGAQAYGPGSITLAGSATIGGTNRWDLRNGANTLNTPTNAYTLTKVGAGFTAFVGTTISTNLGDVYILGGTLGYETGTKGFGNPTNTVYIGTNATLEMYQATVPFNKFIVLSNGATIAPDSGGGSPGTSPATQNIIVGPIRVVSGKARIACNYNNGCAISNVISGAGGVTFDYNAYNRLYAANTYQGDTDVLGGVYMFSNSCIVSTNQVYVNVGPLFITNNAYVNCGYLNDNYGALVVGGAGNLTFGLMRVGGAILDVTGRTNGTLTLTSGETLRIDNGAVIKGAIVAGSGSVVAPGGDGYLQNTGTNFGSLTFQAGSMASMDVSVGAATNSDVINVTNVLTYGGTLKINSSTKLAAGNAFKLFNAGSYSGSFASISNNLNGQFVTWDASKLSVNGTLTVATATSSSNPTITNSLAGGVLSLSWAADHLGWHLQSQTNSTGVGLSSNWVDLPGTDLVTTTNLPINPANGSVFYRLDYHP